MSIKIKSKNKSTLMINKYGLNKFPERIFSEINSVEIEKFLDDYPAKYYAIRDRAKSSGIFKLKVDRDNVLNEVYDYDIFLINVSSANYSDNQLLVGEIEFLSNGDVYLILSVNPNDSVRDAIRNPSFNLKTDIYDKRLNDIPYFDEIYKYIVDNFLIDVVVEFSLFNINVGINNERIIIYELRTDY